MRLKTIALEGVRGLPTRSWDFPASSNAGDLVVVTSRAGGGGKTTFLESIAAAKERVAPYGLYDARWGWLVPRDALAAKARLVWEATGDEVDRHRLPEPSFETESIFGEPATSPPAVSQRHKQLLGVWSEDPLGRVVYIHQGRALPNYIPNDNVRSGAAYRLTANNKKYSFIHGVLERALHRDIRERATALLKTLSPKLVPATLSDHGGAREPWFRVGGDDVVVPYSMLAASEKQAVLFAFAFSCPAINDSVVLIDAPEEGLDEARAAELIRTVLSWGERNQIIVATCAASVVKLAPPGRVVELPG